MTTVYIPDPKGDDSASLKLTPLLIATLVIAAWSLLDQAADLPHPQMVTVSDLQSVSLQFPPEPSSFKAITRWALRFGGVLASEPHQTEKGPQIWVRLEFDYYGVAVDAYAHIPA
jgi:hypothetical protein